MLSLVDIRLGLVLDARLTTLLCKKKIVMKSKEVKTGWQILQNLLRKAVAQERAVLPMINIINHFIFRVLVKFQWN
jgi:hypothetical protein